MPEAAPPDQRDAACPWNQDGEVRDETPRCELEIGEGQHPRYLCFDKPADVAECESCDAQCMRDRVTSMALSPNECVTYPDEIACEPNLNSDACRYFVLATQDWCRD